MPTAAAAAVEARSFIISSLLISKDICSHRKQIKGKSENRLYCFSSTVNESTRQKIVERICEVNVTHAYPLFE